jgi:hypothetical protein
MCVIPIAGPFDEFLVFWSDSVPRRDAITVIVGDTVRWNWKRNVLLTLCITRDVPSALPSSGCDSVRFSNQSYQFTFREEGTYFTVAHTSLDAKPVFDKIVVVMGPPTSKEIRVFVGPYETNYNVTANDSTVEKRRRRDSDVACDDFVISENVSPVFVYSTCFTPLLHDVIPSVGSWLGTEFMLHGKMFSTNVPSNKITIGDWNCLPLSSTEQSVTCRIIANNSFPHLPVAFVPLQVFLRVTDMGDTLVTNITATQVVLLPTITGISPSSGSMGGGAEVTITGDTFSSPTGIVLYLSFPCTITSLQFTEIRCTTEAVRSTETFNVTLLNSQLPFQTLCADGANCTFTFLEVQTPRVNFVTPTIIRGPGPTVLLVEGTGFSTVVAENVVVVGTSNCSLINATETSIYCTLETLPVGVYPLSLQVVNPITNERLGFAVVASAFRYITVEGTLTSVTPTTGGILGGTALVISGFGFHEGRNNTLVDIGNSSCLVGFVNLTRVVCVTASPYTTGLNLITVTSNSVRFVNQIDFVYTVDSTPQVTAISPTSGTPGTSVAITGNLFPTNPTPKSVNITIGYSECLLNPLMHSGNNTTLSCTMGENFAGDYVIELTVPQYGHAQNSMNVQFSYITRVDAISPLNGSFAGFNSLTIQGVGFDPSDIIVEICGQLCPLTSTAQAIHQVECMVPPISSSVLQGTVPCAVTVRGSQLEGMVMASDEYTYLADLTPVVVSINRTRGGTQGGSALLIVVDNLVGSASVTILGVECTVVNQDGTNVECVTGAANITSCDVVMVMNEGTAMYALSEVQFCYVDLWSSPFTWGGGPIPQEGAFVVVQKHQTLVLDINTPVLSFLLIQGTLMFDGEAEDNQVELHSHGILIISGGSLIVGTEEEPFMSKTHIVLYGNALSTELPIYGSKVLALRRGSIEMHGKPINVTWTKLARTAAAGSITLDLVDFVDWEVGGKVVIAATGFSHRENEEMTIASVEVSGTDGVGSKLTLTHPLRYEHISVKQVIAGREIVTAAEVGYFTRSIVVEGNRNEALEGEVMGCEEVFNPGQFDVQTCFQGRFGNETPSDQFGAQIMIHPQTPSNDEVIARLENVEVTWAGQAFRLGRYPIHFHLTGNVSRSYVRACALHQTFNRAVTIHGADHLLVEKNVAFNILGHAYFLEDGNEQYNIIQHNLGIFVRGSSSLLNVDITPATFWIVNPNNIVRKNAAAGGTHFGYWFRIPKHPTGPSFDPSFCPRKMEVLEFSDNSAHSFGWYGIWVFHSYDPSPTGNCWDNEHAPAKFYRFFAWHNDRGAEFADSGAMQLHDSIIMDNKLAGVEFANVILDEWEEGRGAAINNTLIIGRSSITDTCTEAGIKTPSTNYLTISSVVFASFTDEDCFPIQACSQCKFLQGGFETRFRDIAYLDSKQDVTIWKWPHEHVQRGLDGTLTRTQYPASLVPTSALLDPTECPDSDITADRNGTGGSICGPGVRLGRLSIFSPTPDSLESTPTNLSNDNGVIGQQYVLKRLTGGPGYMSIVVLNKTYELTWIEGTTLTNISYKMLISNFRVEDWIIITQHYPQELDHTIIAGMEAPQNGSIFDNPEAAVTGSYSFGENNTTLSYIIKGTHSDEVFTYSTFRCEFTDCIPPPTPAPPTPAPLERPVNALMWSNTSIWLNNQLPVANEDVVITGGMYVVLDIPIIPRLGRLEIQNGSTLELQDGIDHVIEAELIVILGGRLVAGYPDEPFQSKVRFILHGGISTPDYRLDGGTIFSPPIGAKTIAAFGELILNAVLPDQTWTLLARTAATGDDHIEVVDITNWESGDIIVITATSYDAFQTEVVGITSVIGHTLFLNDTLRYTHLVDTRYYSVRAEVGLLNRRIVIEPGEEDIANDTSFGCRVLVSSSSVSIGHALLSGVEFKQCGQIGFTSHDDPRFALAFLNLGESRSSYINDCSFHDGFNTALGLFSTDSVEVSRNVIHGTVGPSMIIEGFGHNVTHNLASLSRFIGTYRDRNEPFNTLWTANYEITESRGIDFRYNHATGGAKAGIHTNGESCEDSPSMIRSNVIHSSLHCIHMGYRDGNPSGCSLLQNFTAFYCYHYGLFSYNRAGIILRDSTLAWNRAAVYVSVIGPHTLSHQVGEKPVIVQNTVIVSANPATRCSDDSTIPAIANHVTSHHGIQSPTNGHVGIIIPSFLSGRGHFPSAPWHSIISYPAISGLTNVTNVTFVDFGVGCAGERDVIIITNPQSEDCNHPMHFKAIQLVGFDPAASIVFIHLPRLSRVNPSDCVDMDCDGTKEVVLKDLDGSFIEHSTSSSHTTHTIISKAEFEWDGDPRRGIGDYRIPTSMLTEPDGSLLDPDSLYPEKGIVRNVTGRGSCVFKQDWNAYKCSGLDHLMLVMESLDPDTELRRLSPIALGASGHVNLINGPMDNGWCGGYTCQERVSTFYSVVVPDLVYTVALTSTNPQNFALHLLNSEHRHVVVLGIVYNTPQRLDVYVTGDDGTEEYVPPNSNFIPTLTQAHGANFYDEEYKRIYVTLRGPTRCRIEVTRIIVLSLDLQVTVEMFFDEDTVVRNLALLFDIPENMIQVANIVMENRKRRQALNGEHMIFTFWIGMPLPSETISPPDIGIDDLFESVTKILEFGGLEDVFNTSQVSIVIHIIKPNDLVFDQTNGVRATPETGGPQPGEAVGIPTFYEQQLELERLQNSLPGSFQVSIPTYLSILNEQRLTAVEGLRLTHQHALVVTMYNVDGSVSSTLGDIITWTLRAFLVDGPDNAFLTGDSVNFVHGLAGFENLTFSHPGQYLLEFFVISPSGADFYVTSHSPITVVRRELGLRILQQPQDGNITFELYPYPSVELVDLSNTSSRVSNHSWRNTAWFIEVHVEGTGDVHNAQLRDGLVVFEDLHIYSAGTYDLVFVVFQVGEGSREYLNYISTVSQGFLIINVPLTRFIYSFDNDYNSTVGGDVSTFKGSFKEWFLAQFPNTEVVNVTVVRAALTEGAFRVKRADEGIEVSLFVTARDREDLTDAIAVINQGPDLDFPFVFGGMHLFPSTVIQDPNFLVTSPSSGTAGLAIYLLLGAIAPAIVFFVGGVLSVLIGKRLYKKLRTSKVSTMVSVSFLLK